MSNLETELAAALDHHRAGRLDEAARHYESVIAAAPDHAAALHNLGVLRAQSGDPAAALDLFERALDIDPDYAHAYLNLAGAQRALGRLAEAAASYSRALSLNPALYPGHFARALVLTQLGRDEEALAHFRRCHTMRRGSPPPDGVSRHKLHHDIAQLRHLLATGAKDEGLSELADHLDALDEQVAWPADPGEPIVIDDGALKHSFQFPPHVAAADAVPAGALSPALDAAAITRAFQKDTPGIAIIDRLLSDDALAALRRSLMDSTIWYDFTHIPGFVAAYLEDGLASPLLLQIARELRAALPDLLGDHPLAQGWAFKGVAGDVPVDVHADAAAVSLNFWITPDEARDGDEGGGLVIYTAQPPADWRIADYDSDTARIRDFLSGHEDARITVPYGENRGVLFDSGLFHGSDAPRFRPGYENHRINITLLFGERGK
jgi:tetratricopeptide (TPR) repeat protein